MSAVTALSRSGAFTRADLDAMPDDGRRHELLDGAIVVTPAPSWTHQTAAFRLAQLLDDARSSELRVLMAPVDVVLADDTVLQPDVLVTRRSDLAERDLPAAPVLAVEVLSPSTRRIDQLLKPVRYATAGTPHYWVVDPVEPSLTAYELQDGAYVEVATVRGNERLDLTQPYAVSIIPAELVADR